MKANLVRDVRHLVGRVHGFLLDRQGAVWQCAWLRHMKHGLFDGALEYLHDTVSVGVVMNK